jgi:sigma54-dependent transcription regulator
MILHLLTYSTVVDDAIRFVAERERSRSTVSSEAATKAAALNPKISTVEDIEDAKHRDPLPNNTTNQVF